MVITLPLRGNNEDGQTVVVKMNQRYDHNSAPYIISVVTG